MNNISFKKICFAKTSLLYQPLSSRSCLYQPCHLSINNYTICHFIYIFYFTYETRSFILIVIIIYYMIITSAISNYTINSNSSKSSTTQVTLMVAGNRDITNLEGSIHIFCSVFSEFVMQCHYRVLAN